jgi:RNA polymerase sigma-70 factor (ECF subfamily)
VLQLAYNMVNNTEDAEDIYQEIFIKVFRNLSQFKFKSEFSTWLFRVVVNYCINFRKKRERRYAVSLENGNPGSEEQKALIRETATTPEGEILNSELSREIEQALAMLSAKQKTVFVLRHYHGHKLKEISKIMGCSEGTIKNYLFRATQRMQQLLYSYSQT